MATSLKGRAPKDSYPELVKVDNTGAGFDTTLRAIADGNGNASPLKLSTTQVSLNGQLWPTAVGTAGQYLSTDASGNLSWGTLNLSTYAPKASPTFTGCAQSDAYTFTSKTATVDSGAVSLDMSAASEYVISIPTGNTTITFTNPPSNNQVVYLKLVNAGQGAIYWASAPKYVGGTAPTYTTSGTDLLGVLYDAASASYTVFVIGLNIQ